MTITLADLREQCVCVLLEIKTTKFLGVSHKIHIGMLCIFSAGFLVSQR